MNEFSIIEYSPPSVSQAKVGCRISLGFGWDFFLCVCCFLKCCFNEVFSLAHLAPPNYLKGIHMLTNYTAVVCETSLAQAERVVQRFKCSVGEVTALLCLLSAINNDATT